MMDLTYFQSSYFILLVGLIVCSVIIIFRNKGLSFSGTISIPLLVVIVGLILISAVVGSRFLL